MIDNIFLFTFHWWVGTIFIIKLQQLNFYQITQYCADKSGLNGFLTVIFYLKFQLQKFESSSIFFLAQIGFFQFQLWKLRGVFFFFGFYCGNQEGFFFWFLLLFLIIL
eukprot:TRINITY_DN3580_c0_g1_i1.p1 TRINITY_DN3580_c0_g1~~TRINITY_DN3580_c0_g1_i1.p1  ORF type:complete len:123 (-),score=10.27 TRINITY_DN3580_c0_g1_i1:61-384(-)